MVFFIRHRWRESEFAVSSAARGSVGNVDRLYARLTIEIRCDAGLDASGKASTVCQSGSKCRAADACRSLEDGRQAKGSRVGFEIFLAGATGSENAPVPARSLARQLAIQLTVLGNVCAVAFQGAR